MKKDLLTVKELAAELRMSPKSIQRAYRKEEIPVQWLGRMARFDLAKIRRAMERKAKAMPTVSARRVDRNSLTLRGRIRRHERSAVSDERTSLLEGFIRSP